MHDQGQPYNFIQNVIPGKQTYGQRRTEAGALMGIGAGERIHVGKESWLLMVKGR